MNPFRPARFSPFIFCSARFRAVIFCSFLVILFLFFGTVLPAQEKIGSPEKNATASGEKGVSEKNSAAKKESASEFHAASQEEAVLENNALKITVSRKNGTLTAADKRTGRVWRQTEDGAALCVQNFTVSSASAEFDFKLKNQKETVFHALIQLLSDENGIPALDVTLHAAPETVVSDIISWPPAFCSRSGERLALAIASGFSLPAEEEIPWYRANQPYSGLRAYYNGHGVNMAFWGHCIPDGSGLMAEILTPDNSCQNIHPVESLASVNAVWTPDYGKFGYDRKIRFRFLSEGGYVKMAQIYREHMWKKGYCVPFSEKFRRNSARRENLEKLFGAANIWCLSGEFQRLYADISGNHPETETARLFMQSQRRIYHEMYDGGMTHLILGAGTNAEILRELGAMKGVLTSRYDIYQDVMNPEMYDKITAIKQEWPREAYPQDIRRRADGSLGTGWAVPQKDPKKPMVNCVNLCDRQSVPYVRKRVAEELTRKPYTARFIDVTACSSWEECYAPEHPMSRRDARDWKQRLLAVPSEEFNLVLGSETGHEAFVPQCDYFEGMMSLIFARVPDAGRNMAQIWEEAPETVEKYQLGERFRIPLWELVYHDCVVSYWYWGDSSNKLPALTPKRDLFNALYGEPPMYVVTPETWQTQRNLIFTSYRRAEPVSRRVAALPMTDHRVLTENWQIQQSEFGERIRVTVNFGTSDFVCENGKTVPAGSYIVEEE